MDHLSPKQQRIPAPQRNQTPFVDHNSCERGQVKNPSSIPSIACELKTTGRAEKPLTATISSWRSPGERERERGREKEREGEKERERERE